MGKTTGGGFEALLSHMEQLADCVPDGFLIYRTDGQNEILHANNRLREIFGCETGAAFRKCTGNTFQGMVFPEDWERVRRSIHAQGAGEESAPDTLEYRIVREDGAVRWAEDRGHFVSGGTYGTFRCVLLRDVTDLRAAQEESIRKALELEREKNASEVKSSFLFNLSHDIRTPMNAIMGFTDLANRHLHDAEKLKDYLEKVAESSRHLLSLIDDLLEMNKIGYGRIELRLEPCDLRRQLDMTLDMFRAQAEEKRLTLRENLDLPPDKAFADVHRFRRIMGNLIGNAVKFTPEGGTVQISARQRQVSESGYARYEFSISDTGVGMTEEFMRRMYAAFEREESSTKTGYIGAGLGLSITKHLLDVMGGSIEVYSKKGEGSTFVVSLPLKLADRNAAPCVETVKEAHKAKGAHRILLVEDIEINRMLAETILEEAGFQVESVPDGCDAVEAIKNHPAWYFDLVLMDIQMPVMNGYEATRSIRALGREDTRQIPIIALSANARDEDKRMSMESGMNQHIAKPFDVAQLITTVNDHIAARE